MEFLPAAFEVPELLEHDRFRLRPITVGDLEKDLGRHQLPGAPVAPVRQVWGWPPADLTLEQNLKDLRWHEEKFQRRASFDDAVMSEDEARLLGWVYVDRRRRRALTRSAGPFDRVAYPGRELALDRDDALPDR